MSEFKIPDSMDTRAASGSTPKNQPPWPSVTKDVGIRHANIPDEASQKAYFESHLQRRAQAVKFGNWIRRNIYSSFKGLSWFNEVNYSNNKTAKKLYLGMIPNNLEEAGIPKGDYQKAVGTVSEKVPATIRTVSIVMPFEAEHIDPRVERGTVVPAVDNVGMSPQEISGGVEALHRALSDAADPRPVYLHCKSGVGRSATVLAAYLMEHQGKTLDEAIDIVHRDRPDAQLKGWLWGKTKHREALEEYLESKNKVRKSTDLKTTGERYATLNQFDQTRAQVTTGATGSQKVEGPGGWRYQLKKSISNIALIRRIKSWWSNRENMGEFVAATVTASLVTGKAAHVVLVHDEKNHQVHIASQYLKDAYQPLGTADSEKRDIELFDGNKKRFTEAIALSALNGDHDVNPGNMMLNNQSGNIARIDFGHAFHDLTRTSYGGQEYSKNRITDFFNREKVDGFWFNNTSRSKLWRYYPEGHIISQEMVNALRGLASSERKAKLGQGLKAAETSFLEIKDTQTQIKIKKSLAAIAKTISGKILDEKLEYRDFLLGFFDVLSKYYEKNFKDMKKTAKTMQLQLDIDDAIRRGEEPKLPKGYEEPIEWVKMHANIPAFKGTFDDYVAARHKVVKVLLREDNDDDASSVSSRSSLVTVSSHGTEANRTAGTVITYMAPNVGTNSSESVISMTVVEPIRPVGLPNIGNTCYMNSALQVLARIPEMRQILMSPAVLNHSDRVVSSLAKLVQAMSTPGVDIKAKNIEAFRKALTEDASFNEQFPYTTGSIGNWFPSSPEHDASEFMNALIQRCKTAIFPERKDVEWRQREKDQPGDAAADLSRKYWANYQERVGSPIDSLFSGQLQTTTTNAEQRSYQFDSLSTLPIEVPPSIRPTSLQALLAKRVEEQSVEGSKVKTADKLSVLPPYLSFQLKRFDNGGNKIETPVSIPNTLDMKPYVAEFAQGETTEYELYSVVNHIGKTISTGHYTADIKEGDDGKWRNYNDSRVQEKLALPESGNKDAYVLVYRRKATKADAAVSVPDSSPPKEPQAVSNHVANSGRIDQSVTSTRYLDSNPEIAEALTKFKPGSSSNVAVGFSSFSHAGKPGVKKGNLFSYAGDIANEGPLRRFGKVAALNAANETLQTRGMRGTAQAVDRLVSDNTHKQLSQQGAGFIHQTDMALSVAENKKVGDIDAILHVAGPHPTDTTLKKCQQQIYGQYIRAFMKARDEKIDAVQIPLLSVGIFASGVSDGKKDQWKQMVRDAAVQASEYALAQGWVKAIGIVDLNKAPILVEAPSTNTTSSSASKAPIPQQKSEAVNLAHPEFRKRMPKITTGKWGTSQIGQDAIYFYGREDAFGIFTNTQRDMPVIVEGTEYKSSEHYFQASKFLKDSPAWKAVKGSTEFGKLPGVARSQKGTKAYDPASDFVTAKKNMWKGMAAKFKQYSDAKKALLATGDRVIVENTSLLDQTVKTRENTWGAGDDGSGENRLGIFLMAMRQELQATGDIPDELPKWLEEDLRKIEPKQVVAHIKKQGR
jgi:ribA/ribD-fused uncharacterized protein